MKRLNKLRSSYLRERYIEANKGGSKLREGRI